MKKRIAAAAVLLAFALAVSLLAGCGAEKAPTGKAKQSQPESKPSTVHAASDVLVILANSGFSDIEYSTTRNALEAAGYKVAVANSSGSASVGMDGTSVKPDVVITDVKSQDYAGLVIIGGGGAEEYFDYQPLLELSRAFAGEGKTVAAICIAPVVLANAGVLKGKTATVFPGEESKLIAAGCDYTGNPVDVDGRFVTGDGPPSSEPFAQAVILSLQSK
jgi:deglycase